jgi:hypothetical protein
MFFYDMTRNAFCGLPEAIWCIFHVEYPLNCSKNSMKLQKSRISVIPTESFGYFKQNGFEKYEHGAEPFFWLNSHPNHTNAITFEAAFSCMNNVTKISYKKIVIHVYLIIL